MGNCADHIITSHSVMTYGPWWLVTCKLPRTPLNGWGGYSDLFASGCSTVWEQATLRAFGESIERYSSIQAWAVEQPTEIRVADGDLSTDLPKCSSAELLRVGLSSDPFDQLSPHSIVKNILNHQDYYVPTNFVHLGYRGNLDTIWSRPSSNGLASGLTKHSTIFRGICEILERDALLLRWLCKSPAIALAIDNNVLPYQFGHALNYLRNNSIVCEFYNLSIDVPICITACVLTSSIFPNFALGLGTSSNPVESCQKALDEAVSARAGIILTESGEGSVHDWKFDDCGIPTKVRKFSDHALFYAFGKYMDLIRQIFPEQTSGSKVVYVSELEKRHFIQEPSNGAELESICRRLGEMSLSVYVCNLTSADVGQPWHVYRVVIPQAMPLTQGTEIRWLGTARLLSYMRDVDLCARNLNLLPHPYA
jgi:ribosomal protein S12 methylthiotransferase accessory factor